MINNNGFSPAQLVFGRNPNLPSIFTAELPALERKPASAVVSLHISALHSARRAFVLSESSEKIKRALRKQTRPSGTIYQIGESVFYKSIDIKTAFLQGETISRDVYLQPPPEAQCTL